MTRLVALFRGINVGGRNRVPMAPLRETFEGLGFTDVSSIIQSGNVCFTGPDTGDPGTVVADIRAAVAERFGVDVPVLLRSAAEVDAALAAHPFTGDGVEPKLHQIMFLADPPPGDAAERLGDHEPTTRYAVVDNEIHAVFPHGSARATLTADLIDRRLGTTVTARNLPTCEKIAAALTRR